MPRKSKTDQELAYLRSLWEELAECELVHGAFVHILLKPSAQRGVFQVVLVMERPETPTGLPAYTARQTMRYPNGGNTLFLPWLWQYGMRFGEYVDNADAALKAPLVE